MRMITKHLAKYQGFDKTAQYQHSEDTTRPLLVQAVFEVEGVEIQATIPAMQSPSLEGGESGTLYSLDNYISAYLGTESQVFAIIDKDCVVRVKDIFDADQYAEKFKEILQWL